MYRIPFNKPFFSGTEWEYVKAAFDKGHVSGDGQFTRRCHQLIEELLGCSACLLTTSCTHALEMSAILLDCGPEDEIIVPSFTFPSTANAFAIRKTKPVFADIRPDTLNLDESRLELLITGKTRAIVPVHYAGVGCEMDAIQKIADAHDLAVVEDNAHGFLGKYKGRPLGTFGCLAAQSFHETKNISCGEGGALLINDPRYRTRAEIIREKGTNRKQFFRGEVDKYSWVDIGSSYLPSDILAAFLLAQLESHEGIQERRRQIWDRYCTELSDWAGSLGVRLPTVPDHCHQAYHMFYLILPSRRFRSNFLEYMKSKGILSVFHYQPLHLSAMGRALGGYEGLCPVTEDMSARLVRLPFYNGLTEGEQADVIESVTRVDR